jgi:hypothetical protein
MMNRIRLLMQLANGLKNIIIAGMMCMITIMVCSLLLAGCSANNARNGDSPLPRISVSNGSFIDSYGNKIYLRGVNLMSKTPQDLIELGFNTQTAAFIAHNNFNVVRLGLQWAYIEPSPGVFNSSYLDHAKQIIQMLAQYHIYTIIDFHQDEYSANVGDGAPGWASLTPSMATSTPDFGFGDNLLCGLTSNTLPCRTDVNYMWQSFWNDEPYNGLGIQEYYVNMVQYVVGYFKNLSSNILGYDLMNEPWVGLSYAEDGCASIQSQSLVIAPTCPGFDQTLGAFYDKLINGITLVDPNTLIMYEPGVLFGVGQYSSPNISVSNNNLVFSYHNYGSNYNQLQTIQDTALVIGNNLDRPIFMGEFGAGMLASTENVMTLVNQSNVPFTYWTLFNNPQYMFSPNPNLPANPEDQGIIRGIFTAVQSIDTANLSALSTLYIYALSPSIANIQTTKNNDTYQLVYNKTSGSAIIQLYVANGCSYSVNNSNAVINYGNNIELIDISQLGNTGTLTVIPSGTGC